MDCKQTDVFPLHRIFWLLKHFISLNSPTWLDGLSCWVAAQTAKFWVERQILVLPMDGGKSSVLPLFIAGCPKHSTTDHQMLASLCHIWPGQFLASSAQTADPEESWTIPKENVPSLPSRYCDYLQSVLVDPVVLKMETVPPAFWPFQ